MADIYENALLTIAATAAEDSSGGLFSDTSSPFSPRQLKTSALHVVQVKNVWDPFQSPRVPFGRSPLLERAWVFQERRLSTRVVHFTDLGLVWECCSMRKSEAGHVNDDWSNEAVARKFLSNIPFKQHIADTALSWRQTVMEYSRLHLTHIRDRLPALAAIVKRTMRSRPADEYIAGMWMSSLPQDLLWLSRDEIRETPEITAPSWSWASVASGVFFLTKTFCFIRANDVTYCNVGPSQLGHAVGASIVLQGHSFTAPVNVLQKESPTLGFQYRFDVPNQGLFTNDSFNSWSFIQDLKLATESQAGGVVGAVSILFLGHRYDSRRAWYGLVLKEVAPNVHERIGICMIWHPRTSPRVLRKARFQDNLDFRINHQAIFELPIRSFRII